ncbi:MAG: zf-HC2 domain-containing protein, partial [Ktedonobacterales bacterium]
MSTPRDLPASVCARFADALPLYTSGELDTAETCALRAHLDICPACRARLSAYDALDAAVRQSYGVPQAAAPFLSFDTIVSRSLSAGPSPDLSAIHTEPGAAAADTSRIVALSGWARRQWDRPIQEEVVMSDLNESLPPPVSTANRATPRRHRARNIAAVAAVVALVALATAIFQGFGGSHGANKSQVGNSTTTHKAALLAWKTVSTFAPDPSTGFNEVSVAPSDPSVAYRGGANLTLQRSRDGGAHWTAVSVPTQDVNADPNTNVTVLVSPLNANTVFVMLNGSDTNPKCPTPTPGLSIGAKIVLSGGYSCNFEYVSNDGGATWQSLNLPGAGTVGAPYTLAGAFQVQG